GVSGGANWGGMAFDPERRIAVVNQSRVANVMTLVPRESAASVKPNPPLRSLFPQRGAPYALQQEVLVSPLGIPCNPPPWGTLTGVDLDSGRVLWEVPLGTTRDRAPFPFWFDWGMPNLGGAIATGSGLVFIGATLDNYLRAFDIDNGREVWKARLPAGGQATPMTYRVGESSRQFVVIAAGGHGGMGTTPGDSLVAFALP
ncbi:MAG: PQQ-binding-like beta-propeller repeat protein, partial [Myxococcota bacterium]